MLKYDTQNKEAGILIIILIIVFSAAKPKVMTYVCYNIIMFCIFA